MRRYLAVFLLVCAACATSSHAEELPKPSRGTTTTTGSAKKAAAKPSAAVDRDCAFRGLGTWVDVYDDEPVFSGAHPPVGVGSVARMHADGVHTLYLQVAKDDPRTPSTITDPALMGAFLRAAHSFGMKVVAWYLPTHRDPALDIRRAVAMARFHTGGQYFDGVALDIEGTSISDIGKRNARLLATAAALDHAAGTRPVGAIVFPPVGTDVLAPSLWPDFPWKQLARHVDVWLPMAYWTYRTVDSNYRDAYRYTAENITRLRADVGNPEAAVHIIGGIADLTSAADEQGFMRGVHDAHAVGGSLYDYNTMSAAKWSTLRQAAPRC
jgi:hypothetical protein